jgi:hypothetical protein
VPVHGVITGSLIRIDLAMAMAFPPLLLQQPSTGKRSNITLLLGFNSTVTIHNLLRTSRSRISITIRVIANGSDCCSLIVVCPGLHSNVCAWERGHDT